MQERIKSLEQARQKLSPSSQSSDNEVIAAKQVIEFLLQQDLAKAHSQAQRSQIPDIGVSSVIDLIKRGQLTAIAKKMDSRFLSNVEAFISTTPNLIFTSHYPPHDSVNINKLYHDTKKRLIAEGNVEPGFADISLGMYTDETPFFSTLNTILGNHDTSTKEEQTLALVLGVAITKSAQDKALIEHQNLPQTLFRGQSRGLQEAREGLARVKEYQKENYLSSMNAEQLSEKAYNPSSASRDSRGVNISSVFLHKVASLTPDILVTAPFATGADGAIFHLINPADACRPSNYCCVQTISRFPDEHEHVVQFYDDTVFIPVQITEASGRKPAVVDVMCMRSNNFLRIHSTEYALLCLQLRNQVNAIQAQHKQKPMFHPSEAKSFEQLFKIANSLTAEGYTFESTTQINLLLIDLYSHTSPSSPTIPYLNTVKQLFERCHAVAIDATVTTFQGDHEHALIAMINENNADKMAICTMILRDIIPTMIKNPAAPKQDLMDLIAQIKAEKDIEKQLHLIDKIEDIFSELPMSDENKYLQMRLALFRSNTLQVLYNKANETLTSLLTPIAANIPNTPIMSGGPQSTWEPASLLAQLAQSETSGDLFMVGANKDNHNLLNKLLILNWINECPDKSYPPKDTLDSIRDQIILTSRLLRRSGMATEIAMELMAGEINASKRQLKEAQHQTPSVPEHHANMALATTIIKAQDKCQSLREIHEHQSTHARQIQAELKNKLPNSGEKTREERLHQRADDYNVKIQNAGYKSRLCSCLRAVLPSLSQAIDTEFLSLIAQLRDERDEEQQLVITQQIDDMLSNYPETTESHYAQMYMAVFTASTLYALYLSKNQEIMTLCNPMLAGLPTNETISLHQKAFVDHIQQIKSADHDLRNKFLAVEALMGPKFATERRVTGLGLDSLERIRDAIILSSMALRNNTSAAKSALSLIDSQQADTSWQLKSSRVAKATKQGSHFSLGTLEERQPKFNVFTHLNTVSGEEQFNREREEQRVRQLGLEKEQKCLVKLSNHMTALADQTHAKELNMELPSPYAKTHQEQNKQFERMKRAVGSVKHEAQVQAQAQAPTPSISPKNP